MSIELDYFGYRFNDILPAFVIASDKLVLHRMSNRFMDLPALDAKMTAEGYTPGPHEFAHADHWLFDTHRIGNTGTASLGGQAGGVAPQTGLFVTTNFPADGDNTEVGTLTLNFGGKALSADATLVLNTVFIVGGTPGVDDINVALTKGMTEAQASAAIIAAWKPSVTTLAPATAGVGTEINFTPIGGCVIDLTVSDVG